MDGLAATGARRAPEEELSGKSALAGSRTLQRVLVIISPRPRASTGFGGWGLFEDDFRVLAGDTEENPGWPGRLPVALFPVLEGAQADSHAGGKLFLRESQRLPDTGGLIRLDVSDARPRWCTTLMSLHLTDALGELGEEIAAHGVFHDRETKTPGSPGRGLR